MGRVQTVVDALTEHGVESFEVEEEGYVLVEVPCGPDEERDCHELIGEIETWLSERGLPWVPEEVEGRIVIRPPAT